jgi:hypothetical protein
LTLHLDSSLIQLMAKEISWRFGASPSLAWRFLGDHLLSFPNLVYTKFAPVQGIFLVFFT